MDILMDKYVFWDIDGTLAPFRFTKNGVDGLSLDKADDDFFLTREPSAFMQKVVATSFAREHIIVSHYNYDKEKSDKLVWLNEHFPMMQQRILLPSNLSKADMILSYCRARTIPLEDVVFVDDVIPYLQEAERKGIKSYHISSFLDWEVV